MNKEEYKELMKSVARIEWLIFIIMQEKYGEKQAKKVYDEVNKLIDNELFKEANTNEN